MAGKIDPYDVAALERSLNDSATRVSTIWVSFLIFSLYLLTAATTVTHRQLFLAEPVKLPVLNIDLPLRGFFFLAPILFVIFHAYVLLQVLLLGRTAAAYNEAVKRKVKSPQANATIRQRLANTLFAQIFAGSPRERDGWLGWLLKAMAWITLAIAPILILLAFQFAFLPYHSHLVTWTHRLLIVIELAAVFMLWPLTLDARRDIRWPKLWHPAPLISIVLFGGLSMSIATFPGEPHFNLFTGQSLGKIECHRWFTWRPLRFLRIEWKILQTIEWNILQTLDRIDLPNVKVVDDDILAKIERGMLNRKLPTSGGERTRNLRDRNLNCANLSSSDLRRVDLSSARMYRANLSEADLQGASLDGARLESADLTGARLQGASLNGAYLQQASLSGAHLEGASLVAAWLQGASLSRAHLQGASLSGARLQGASLRDAQLQGASLRGAQLQGASLSGAELQGAFLFLANLQGASLVSAKLQGADLRKTDMWSADLTTVTTWRTRITNCRGAFVKQHLPDAIIDFSLDGVSTQATPEKIAQYIERSVANIPHPDVKEAARTRMRTGLIVNSTKDDTAAIAQVWNSCEQATVDIPLTIFIEQNVATLSSIICSARRFERAAIANGIIYDRLSSFEKRFAASLASDLLNCSVAAQLEWYTIKSLRKLVSEPPPVP